MNRTVRGVATALAIGFALSFAARAVWWIERPAEPWLLIASIALYTAVFLVAVLAHARRTARAPLWACVLGLLASVAVPVMVNLSLEGEHRTAPFATWYIGALGVLGVVFVVRRRFVAGWAVLAVLIVASSAFLGTGTALRLGLLGSAMWVVVAQLLVLFWDRAVRDTERLADIQQAVSAWHATQQVRQRERRVRARYALSVAGPVLSRAVAAEGVLTDDERLQARLAEGRLRDELRGSGLLNDAVRTAIEEVRRRGVSVTVFDEGGLDELDEARRERIRDELAEVLRSAESERVIIRASRDPRIAVTVVGRASRSPEEESVGLFHEIPREASARE